MYYISVCCPGKFFPTKMYLFLAICQLTKNIYKSAELQEHKLTSSIDSINIAFVNKIYIFFLIRNVTNQTHSDNCLTAGYNLDKHNFAFRTSKIITVDPKLLY